MLRSHRTIGSSGFDTSMAITDGCRLASAGSPDPVWKVRTVRNSRTPSIGGKSSNTSATLTVPSMRCVLRRSAPSWVRGMNAHSS